SQRRPQLPSTSSGPASGDCSPTETRSCVTTTSLAPEVDTRPATPCGNATIQAISPRSPKTVSSRRTRRAPTPRTRELTKAYLEVHGITSMMDVPILDKGQVYGILCHEHVGPARRWTSDDEAFAGNLADLASLALETGERRTVERRWDAVVKTIQEAVFVLD